MMDGWLENGYHFCALFACLPNNNSGKSRILLSFSPLIDQTSQSANSHFEWIKYVLSVYSVLHLDAIVFFCDNTNTMPAISVLLDCSFIGELRLI